jgi:ABC-type proline/glycine betaine transport system ATPase subunit
MAIKLEVKNLYKIFGEHPGRAFAPFPVEMQQKGRALCRL